jgi:hypothetical protein
MKALREHRHLVLFLSLVVLLGFQPLAHGPRAGLIVFDVVATLLVGLIFLFVFERAGPRLVALGAAAIAVVSNWAAYVLRGDAHIVANVLYHGAVGLFLVFAVVVILKNIFKRRVIRADDFLGGLCGYLLAGVAWGNLYALIETVSPGSFSVQADFAWQLAERHPRRFLFNFFSFVTLPAMGSGNITPVRPIASWFVALEAIFGQFYLAIVVAQVVGLKLAQATRSDLPAQGPPRRG